MAAVFHPVRFLAPTMFHGDYFWDPAPLHPSARILVGDVGYIHRGCFHLLSAGCPSGSIRLGEDILETLKPLEIGSAGTTSVDLNLNGTQTVIPDIVALLVEDLDKTLSNTSLDHSGYRNCQLALRRICRNYGVLPKSILSKPSNALLRVSTHPYSSTGPFDAYRGSIDGEDIAIKKLRIYAKGDEGRQVLKALCEEVVVWKYLHHPNIHLFRHIIDLEPFTMVSEWMPNGNILEYTKAYPEKNRLSLISDAAEGLAYLHSRGIVHGDLNGINVLINNHGRALLADFGLMPLMANLQSTGPGGGSLRWAAPELLTGKNVNSKETDMYAFGMLTWEVFSESAPFVDSPPTTVAVQVLSGKRPGRPKHGAFTDELWNLTRNCWEQDPRGRPHISEVVSRLRSISITSQGHVHRTLGSILRSIALRLSHAASSIWGSPNPTRPRGARSNLSPSDDPHGVAYKELRDGSVDEQSTTSTGGAALFVFRETNRQAPSECERDNHPETTSGRVSPMHEKAFW